MLKRTSIALIIAATLSGAFSVLPVFAQDGQTMQDGMMSSSKMKQDKMKDDKMSKHRKKAKHRSSRKPKMVEKMSGDKM